MTLLTRTTAGLALFALALAPAAHAQQSHADQDEPGVRITRQFLASPEAPGADQDVPGRRSAPVQVPTRQISDRDDAAMPLASPKTAATGQRLDMGRDLVIRVEAPAPVAENAFPNGRDLPAVAAKASTPGPRTMTENGRPLGSRAAAPLADDIAESPEAPGAKTSGADSGLALSSSAPNPVDRSARIAFTLPADGAATLTLFDVRGREVATLFDGVARAGTTTVTLDASALAAGTYVYVLDAAGDRVSRRLQVVR